MAASTTSQKPPTLRTLRHSASYSRSTTDKPAKTRSTASLSVKEQIARRAAKPLIQGRQFKWISPAQRMKEMQVDMSRVRDRRDMLEGEEEAGTDETHSLFAHSLSRSALINLSLPFIAFSRNVEPKARSLPLVIHHRHAIVTAICSAMRGAQKDVELCGEAILE
jgi:U3 small nucleolar RNA-associated protein 20